MKKLINKVATRKFILEVANSNASKMMDKEYIDSAGRTWDYSRCYQSTKKFTSVGQEFLDSIDVDIRNLIRKKLKDSPPRGKTVK
tara:strand:+ start:3024 stop:3278 length:255 start_codon:yes stop_codon:yes gene_type:complete